MMVLKRVTAQEMGTIDRRAIHEFGISAACLMENAGRMVADEAVKMVRRRRTKCVCVVCGNGNNGGDGFVAARHLLNKGAKVIVLFNGGVSHLSSEAAVNYRAVRKLKIPFFGFDPNGFRRMRKSDLILDALFGVGLSRPVEGRPRAVIEAMNDAGVPVLAFDIPSGLDATTGKALGICVNAALTVTLAYPKKGLFIADGPRYSGRVVVADIGIPYSLKI